MINILKQILQEIELEYPNKIDNLLEEMNVEHISELHPSSFETIIIEDVQDIAYYAVNGYDLHEANVTLEEFNIKDLDLVECQGGNTLIKCGKKDENKPGYIILYNDESGITVIKIN